MSCDIVTSWSQYLREDVQTITKRKDLDSTWGMIPIGVRKGLPPEKPDRLPAFAHGSYSQFGRHPSALNRRVESW